MRVVLLASIDAVVRDVASLAVLCDLGRAVEVRHDLVTLPNGAQEVRCTVADTSGLVYREDFELDHGCLSCTVREGLVPTLRWISEQDRWDDVLVTLPVSASPEQVAWQLSEAAVAGILDGVDVASVVAAVDPARLEADLLGDDLLSERGLELSAVDERAVGEALASVLDHADVVVTLDSPDARADALLEHVLPTHVRRCHGTGELDVAELFGARHDVERVAGLLRPTRRRARSLGCCEGVWTQELASERPFHPVRLLENIERLGAGELRARGCFWLPSRPGVICVWDGAGGQLSIGEVGLWNGSVPFTRLVVTGTGEELHTRVREAFETAVLREDEASTAVARWAGRPDGLEDWLGEVELDDAV